MWCAVCQTNPCQMLSGNLALDATWLLSDETEQMMSSGEWCSLFEHLVTHISEPEAEKTASKRKSPSTVTAHEESQSAPNLPSQERNEYWIWAHFSQSPSLAYNAEKVGKWLVFVPATQIDSAWAKVKDAVEQGRLGETAKVATAKASLLEINPEERVICVYTDDWTDEYEVRRVHAELYDLGFVWFMSYKTDSATRAGIYRHTSHKRVGVYRLGPHDAKGFKAGKYAFLRARKEGQNNTSPTLLLTVELVPRPCWYSNLRKVVTRSTWDTLRRQVYAHYHYQCGICQMHGQLYCHEIWHYDDDQHMQILHGFIALCEWCHHVKHLGLAGILADEGNLNYDRVIAHFLAVNGCTQEDFKEHRQQAFAQWKVRNTYEWRTDLGAYAYLIVNDADKKHL